LHRLEEKQESLLSRVVKSSNQLEKTLQAETPQPIAETTQVVVCTVPAGPVRV
jgi:hypothetical protein